MHLESTLLGNTVVKCIAMTITSTSKAYIAICYAQKYFGAFVFCQKNSKSITFAQIKISCAILTEGTTDIA